MSIGRHEVVGRRPGVVAAELDDSPREAVSEPVREQSSGPAAPERGARRATDVAMSANGDERGSGGGARSAAWPSPAARGAAFESDGQTVVPKMRWRRTGSRKRGSAARCSGRSVVEEGVGVGAGAAAGGTGGAAGDEAGAPVNWRSRWWR
eukprot:3284550-Pleurochrysis_carterae.AAC.1